MDTSIYKERQEVSTTIDSMVDQILYGEALEVLCGMPDNSIDAIVTDPPYFLPVQSYVGTRENGYTKRSLADVSVLQGFYNSILEEIDRVVHDTGSLFFFCDAQSYPVFYQAMYPYCKHVRLLVWDKITSYNGYTWRHQHELIAWGERDKAERIPTGDGDVLRCHGVCQKERIHPAQKPVKILRALISKVRPKEGLIVDPFCGSGSTCVAAKQEGYHYIGIELDSGYVEVAKARIAKESPLDLFTIPELRVAVGFEPEPEEKEPKTHALDEGDEDVKAEFERLKEGL